MMQREDERIVLKKELTPAEVLVMKCIWDNTQDMVLSEVVAIVNDRYNKDWKPQTVSTYLAHLVQKNFLKMERNGKIYTYHPLVEEADYRDKEMNAFVKFWGCGSPSEFLSAFFKKNQVEEQELDNLKKLIDGMAK